MARQFREYEKTCRIVVDQIPIVGKVALSDKESKNLLGGVVTITEKMDGANSGVYKRGDEIFLQKRRANIDGSHEQFKFFDKWHWDNYSKLEKLKTDTVTYGELLRCVHTIYYDTLPDWFLVFDIWDIKNEKYLEWSDVCQISHNAGLYTVPFLYDGIINSRNELFKMMPKRSKYGEIAEGMVIKNYKRQIRGKLVKAEFIKSLDESDHWTKGEIRYNKVGGQ